MNLTSDISHWNLSCLIFFLLWLLDFIVFRFATSFACNGDWEEKKNNNLGLYVKVRDW